MLEPRVSIVLDNWNGRRHLERCLPALMRLTYRCHEIILVDDASTDDSVAYVTANYPTVTVIAERAHHGFAGANNIGIRAARGDIVFLLNTDTEPEPDCLEPLVTVFDAHRDVGACQSKLLRMRAPHLLNSAGSWFTPLGFLRHRSGEPEQCYNDIEPIFGAMGAAMAIRRDALDRVGLFDDDAYAYFEDSDLSWRLWIAGYTVLYVPASRVPHLGGGTSTEEIITHSYKNRLRSLLRNLEGPTMLRVLPAHLLCVLALIPFYALRGERHWARAIAHAIVWNGRHLGETWALRRGTQRTRRRRDRDFLPRISRPMSPWFFLHHYVLQGTLPP